MVELSALLPYFTWYEPTLTSSISTANARSLYLLTSSQANAQQSPNYHAMNANTLILWQVLYSLISRTTWTQHRLYPFPNQQRPTDCSISDSTGNMKAETWLTNVSLSICKLASSFVGSINADSLRFLNYKAQKVVIKWKLDAKKTTPTRVGLQTKLWLGQQSVVLRQVAPFEPHALTDIDAVNATITAR
jgi:hypothetical protein